MDRRSFLTAMLGVAGAAVFATAVRPINAVAGVPGAGSGILDELEAPEAETFDDEGTPAEVEQVYYRRYHRRYYRRYYRRGWRRVCHSYWRHGRRRVRCYRRRAGVVFRY
ncbi:protamine-2 (modular protein) [Mesorhizobium kowhaii]|uniref:Protamine-2 (Modular protein) n=1 Tax=Mesorhizobium kowhaii TaxID=1300272 RepID=A0A2W7BYY8_9HYPH|nr:protamine-2 (modular protein) [Mesorhizobium kowhaii]